MFELFGTNFSHQVEYLGTFRTELETQEVADNFKAIGYSKLKSYFRLRKLLNFGLWEL